VIGPADLNVRGELPGDAVRSTDVALRRRWAVAGFLGRCRAVKAPEFEMEGLRRRIARRRRSLSLGFCTLDVMLDVVVHPAHSTESARRNPDAPPRQRPYRLVALVAFTWVKILINSD
jgi:hypothetical protein